MHFFLSHIFFQICMLLHNKKDIKELYDLNN